MWLRVCAILMNILKTVYFACSSIGCSVNVSWVKLVDNVVPCIMSFLIFSILVISYIKRKKLKFPTIILDLSGYFCNSLNIFNLTLGCN